MLDAKVLKVKFSVSKIKIFIKIQENSKESKRIRKNLEKSEKSRKFKSFSAMHSETCRRRVALRATADRDRRTATGKVGRWTRGTLCKRFIQQLCTSSQCTRLPSILEGFTPSWLANVDISCFICVGTYRRSLQRVHAFEV